MRSSCASNLESPTSGRFFPSVSVYILWLWHLVSLSLAAQRTIRRASLLFTMEAEAESTRLLFHPNCLLLIPVSRLTFPVVAISHFE